MKYIKNKILLFNRVCVFLCLAISILSCSFNETKNKENTDVSLVKKHNSKVFFKNLNDGDSVVNPIVVEMGVKGMKIKPAGELETGTGHHHIIIDNNFIKYGQIIPMNETNLHFGKGDSVAELNLTKGPHVLTLQFANGMHMSYGEQFSKSINIYVK
tara:strand:- start:2154 stop:2624 length:471 start_codon:yes stop_codon:yes gene_type:complete